MSRHGAGPGIALVDTSDYILAHHDDVGGLGELSAPGGHLNRLGNRLVAEAVVVHLAREERLSP